MNAAEKIGLLPGFGWLAGHSFWITLLICLMITPGMMIVTGLIGESRLIPLSYSHQFLSFFPGDMFLSGMAAGLLALASRLPSQERFYNSVWFHILTLVFTTVVAIWMTIGEYTDPNRYEHRALMSPTKLYHNLVLYGGYGYLVITVLVAVLAASSSRSWLLVACLVPGLVWASMLVLDNQASEQVKEQRFRTAHINDWKPIWR